MILVTVLLVGIVGGSVSDSDNVLGEIASEGPEAQTTSKIKHHQTMVSYTTNGTTAALAWFYQSGTLNSIAATIFRTTVGIIDFNAHTCIERARTISGVTSLFAT